MATWYELCIRRREKELQKIDRLLEKYKYDQDALEHLKVYEHALRKELVCLSKAIPEKKLKEYGGPYKCLRCGCVVNQYAKYCHYCGQRFALNDEITKDREDRIEGWCADK